MITIKTAFPRLRCLLTTGLATLFLLTSAQQAHATNGYLSTWSGLYPGSASDNNSSCQLCHGSNTQNINPYGFAIAACNPATSGNITQRINAAEGQNSDGDPGGFSNLAETNADTQPGWTTGQNQLWGRNNCSDQGSQVAPANVGALDPAAPNVPPTADANGPYNGTAGQQVTFDGSASTDPDGTITAYDWTFGDGNTGTGVNPVNTYAAAGSYTVTLTVTDNGGLTDTATSTADIVAAPQDPVADPNGPYTGTVGIAVAFDGSGSFDPDGGTINQYLWDFGDGNTGIGVAPGHTYATAATYTVTLTVVDDEGAQSAPATTTATISPPPANVPPVSDPNGPYSGTTGQPVSFDGSGSSDPDGTIVTYDWDFGDGGTGTGVSPSYTYAAAGDYTVILTVTDDAGDSDVGSTTASISDAAPPVACEGLDIDRASYSSRRDRLRVEGDGGQRNAGDFVLLNAFDLTQILAEGGSERDDREFDFRVRRLDPVPCVVRVEQPGSGRCDIREVSNAPDDCAPKEPPVEPPPGGDVVTARG